MEMESLGKRRNENTRDTAPPEVTIQQHQKERRAETTFAKRTYEIGRIAAIAAALQACGPLTESHEDTTSSRDSAFVAEMLDLQESQGSVRLSSGMVIEIPVRNRFGPVEVHLPKGKSPDRVIVLFKQLHHVDEKYLGGSTEKRERLNTMLENQGTIYDELRTMVKNGNIKKVCMEGLFNEESMQSIESDYQKYLPEIASQIVVRYLPEPELAKTLKRKDEILAQKTFSRQDSNELDFTIAPVVQRYGTEYKLVAGAGNVLAYEKAIGLCPASDRATHSAVSATRLARIVSKKPTTWTAEEKTYVQKVALKDREDVAVRLAAAEGDSAIAIQYGVAHQFTTSVAEWNKDNPSLQFALVSVPGEKKDTTANK